MSDALSQSVSFDYLYEEIIQNVVSEQGQRHCWLWLTKRPHRMSKFSRWIESKGIAWPSNLWAGTSITDQRSTVRIGHLLRVGSADTIRFLSVEPQVEPLDLDPWLPDIDWILHGGESGQGARVFHVEWALDLIQKCRQFGKPYFLKQLGSIVASDGQHQTFNRSHASDWNEWNPTLRVREVPIPHA